MYQRRGSAGFSELHRPYAPVPTIVTLRCYSPVPMLESHPAPEL